MAKKINSDCCYPHYKNKGCMMFVLGLLILANAYWQILSWDLFIGGIFVICGIVGWAVHIKG